MRRCFRQRAEFRPLASIQSERQRDAQDLLGRERARGPGDRRRLDENVDDPRIEGDSDARAGLEVVLVSRGLRGLRGSRRRRRPRGPSVRLPPGPASATIRARGRGTSAGPGRRLPSGTPSPRPSAGRRSPASPPGAHTNLPPQRSRSHRTMAPTAPSPYCRPATATVGGSTVVTPVPTYQEAVRPSSRPYGAFGGDHVASDRSTFSVWCSIRGPPANLGERQGPGHAESDRELRGGSAPVDLEGAMEREGETAVDDVVESEEVRGDLRSGAFPAEGDAPGGRSETQRDAPSDRQREVELQADAGRPPRRCRSGDTRPRRRARRRRDSAPSCTGRALPCR